MIEREKQLTVELRVWDLGVRASHWLLAGAIAAAVITGTLGGALIDWHGRIGLLIIGVIVFRLLWGVLGSTHARFASFFPTPRGIIEYLRGRWHGLGHNPVGALGVFSLLFATLAMAATGLFANDTIAFHGPLAELVDGDTSDRFTGWHARIVLVLGALVALHIGAMVFYARVKKLNLIVPMLTGRKRVIPSQVDRPIDGGGPLRFLVAVFLAGLVAWGLGSPALVNRLVGRRDPPASAARKSDSSSVATAAGTPGW